MMPKSSQPPLCIILARPTTGSDPSLMQANGGYGLFDTVRMLQEAGIISRSVFSVPHVVPDNIVGELNAQGHRVLISEHDAPPQRRLADVMAREQVDYAVVFTSYTLLPDAEGLAQAIEAVAMEHADLVYAQNVIPPKFFMVVSRRGAEFLAKRLDKPVPPFVFPAKLAALAEETSCSVDSVDGIESPGERFLWELFFSGRPNALPRNVFERFLDQFPLQRRFDKSAFREFILGAYGLESLDSLETGLGKMRRWEPSIRLAMHINYERYLAPHFPAKRAASLEIGHGRTGITAQLVGLSFEQTYGVDLLKHSEDGIAAARDFLSALIKDGLISTGDSNIVDNPPHFLVCRLENAGLETDSIDFCFSRMVLEHIDNMPTLARELRRIMRPGGGVMVHEIGTQDHEDLSHIHFEFLRYSPEEWASMNKGTNLLRPCDFVDIFEAEGFDCEVLERDVRIVRPQRLHPHWDEYSDEDLYCPRVVIKCIRRAA